MAGSGKAVIRTATKHQRRRHNDIARIRNFMNKIQTHGDDCVWYGIVNRMLNIRADIKWQPQQRERYIGIPNWFWPKFERVLREYNIQKGPFVRAEVDYMYQAGQSTVREVTFYGSTQKRIADLFGIRIIALSAVKYALPIMLRMRDGTDMAILKKERPPKPAHKYASTEEIDMPNQEAKEQPISIDKMLSLIPEMEMEIERLGRELARARDNLDYTREQIRTHLSNNYGI
ncbi:hypothetical protein Asfd1_133 [Aeromonas phage Asfd_1]|nr:hypothetical protein Asfd1_133 [Aeromonas phage Asfd_1]